MAATTGVLAGRCRKKTAEALGVFDVVFEVRETSFASKKNSTARRVISFSLSLSLFERELSLSLSLSLSLRALFLFFFFSLLRWETANPEAAALPLLLQSKPRPLLLLLPPKPSRRMQRTRSSPPRPRSRRETTPTRSVLRSILSFLFLRWRLRGEWLSKCAKRSPDRRSMSVRNASRTDSVVVAGRNRCHPSISSTLPLTSPLSSLPPSVSLSLSLSLIETNQPTTGRRLRGRRREVWRGPRGKGASARR